MPTNTPGSAIAPKRSCHFAVLLISAFLTTLEVIVPEKTPLGKVTCASSDQVLGIMNGTVRTDKVVWEPEVYVINKCIH